MDKKYVFGVDVGGTSVKIGLFLLDGTLQEKWEIPTNTNENGMLILPDIKKSLDAKIEEKNIVREEILGVGMGVPGPVDAEGVVHKAVNLGWDQFPIQRDAKKLFGLPVKVGNDASVAALGELWQGAAKGKKSLVLFTLGTGVGGGIIVDEKIVAGAVGGGGELGHAVVKFDEEIPCNCGNHGCLEQYASATGIVRLAKEAMESGKFQTKLSAEDISAKAIADLAKTGDPLCTFVLAEVGRFLGIVSSYAACFIDPELILIGGGVSKAGDIVLEPIREVYKKYAFHSMKNTPIEVATLGNDAGIYGSARQLL
ncbi:MAG: ROK family glucokinase [Bacillota bacterium]